VLLVSSTFAQAQVYQTYSMLFVRVEGDQNAFEELQDKYMVGFNYLKDNTLQYLRWKISTANQG